MTSTEFAGLHIDPKVIGERNSKIQGPDIKRKNNCIVNTGGKKNTLLQKKEKTIGKSYFSSRQTFKRRVKAACFEEQRNVCISLNGNDVTIHLACS